MEPVPTNLVSVVYYINVDNQVTPTTTQ